MLSKSNIDILWNLSSIRVNKIMSPNCFQIDLF